MRMPGIVGAGACTPIGLTLTASTSAIRAGVNSFSKPAYLRDNSAGAAMKVSMVDGLMETSASKRMLALAVPAAQEAIGNFSGATIATARSGLFLALAEERPGFDSGMARTLAQTIARESGLPFSKEYAFMQRVGNGAGLMLMRQALELLNRSELDLCLIGGVDSYIEIEALHWIERCGRLHGDEKPNGLVPGEAAAFVLLASAEHAERMGVPVLCELLAAGESIEPSPWYSGQPTMGNGLTTAVRGVLADPAATDLTISRVYADLNGESWRANEWGYAYLRSAKRYRSPLDVIHPANWMGDTGAAAGPLLTALAAVNLSRSNESGQAILVWTASGMTPVRSACVLRKAA